MTQRRPSNLDPESSRTRAATFRSLLQIVRCGFATRLFMTILCAFLPLIAARALLGEDRTGPTLEEGHRARAVVLDFLNRLVRDGELHDNSVLPDELQVKDRFVPAVMVRPVWIEIEGTITAWVRRSDFVVTRLSLENLARRPLCAPITIEQATTRADAMFARYVPNDVRRCMGAPTIELRQPIKYSQTGLAEWVIERKRTIGGFDFPLDHCTLTLLEDGQFSGFVWKVQSLDPPTTEVKVDRDNAIRLGREGAASIMSRFVQFQEQRAEECVATEVKLVNCNWCHLWEDRDEHRFAYPSRETRVAWVVEFVARDLPTAGRVNDARHVRVWIDAATGELLGGEYTG